VTAPLANHPFDRATHVERTSNRLRGSTSDDYWAFVGPFGGATTATLLRAAFEDPDRAGDPLAITVNFCAPVAQGHFDIALTRARANRSTQHWSMVASQEETGVVATATAIFASRRPTFAHQPAQRPDVPAYETLTPLETRKYSSWVQRYEFRFIAGGPIYSRVPFAEPAGALSQYWLRDEPARPIDFLSLAAMSDSFFARIFHVRGTIVPFGTVSLTTYFHVDAADLIRLGSGPIFATVDASVFNKNFGDQKGELWSGDGQLLATCHQIAYFRDPDSEPRKA
jgi:acyl-CoA thioesterase